ncbi:MAG: DNA cytosine methyltransferase [Rhodobacteraceae bacterium]|nr:MAG: DNA cytosine methyltransferase [Paracoccaceae bacterium]
MRQFTYYEFFAGGGMVSAALGPRWRRLFANDIDPEKAAAFAANWGADGLLVRDVRAVTVADLPGRPDLVWASSPCQDLSLGGRGAGFAGARSAAFLPFWALVEALAADGRAPAIVAFENVYGALVSRGGADLRVVADAFRRAGYRFGAAVLDAAAFLPQSRPRLFVVGLRRDMAPPPGLAAAAPEPDRHPTALVAGLRTLLASGDAFLLAPPRPPARNIGLADLLQDDPPDAPWLPDAETARRLAMIAPRHRPALDAARAARGRVVAPLFRRTRVEAGVKVSRYEPRWDGLAGCLRTPAGGSSRQEILVFEHGRARMRLFSPRETARLMGLPDGYALPARRSAAFRLTGDGVAVPVVRWLRDTVFEPALEPAAAPLSRAPAV